MKELLKKMNNIMYVNFNFIRLNCPNCRANLIENNFLRQLSEDIKKDSKNLKINETLLLNYELCCPICSFKFTRNIEIERTKNILIAT